ncbi:ribonuclease domain-containing protein [Actinokineospora sp. G85]|uniref:ribonuclease domain-containing protein n=1 Tax=Actinokineospora sp. G85 TaxID=3406626 RepID=UPI003C76CAC4
MGSRKRITGALVGLVLLVLLGWLTTITGEDSPPPPDPAATASSTAAPRASTPRAANGMAVLGLTTLPEEARDTWALIEKGGPFPYPRNDGTTFGNREGRLPKQPGDYYKEYTVPTPGSRDRGARRLVTGESDEVYYTEDHYESFAVVDVTK